MQNFSRFILVQILFCISLITSAQIRTSDKIRPQWLKQQPIPTNASFTYEIVNSVSSSLDGAREKCLAQLISGSGLENGIVAVSDYTTDENLSQTWINGKLEERLDYSAKTTTKAESRAVSLHVKEVAEYWTYDGAGNYYLSKLYAKSRLNSTPSFDNIYLTEKYGARGLWRSMIVPGWGQMHKGSYAKGGIIMGGTVALAGGIIFTESMRQSCITQINQTHSSTAIKQLAANMTNWAIGRNICIGAIAALYAYNLVDAIVAPGARRVVVTPGYMSFSF